MLTATPRLDVFIEAFPLSVLHRLAMVPRVYIDALDDLIPEPLAKIVRVHRIELPATIAVILLEPGMARVSNLVSASNDGRPPHSALVKAMRAMLARPPYRRMRLGKSTSDICMPDGSKSPI
jgi:hypothetical protein